MKPDFAAQTAEGEHFARRNDWISKRTNEASEKGCTFFRVSDDPARQIILFEGWKTPPQKMPPPEFFLTAEKQS